jgi:hypothetical protein
MLKMIIDPKEIESAKKKPIESGNVTKMSKKSSKMNNHADTVSRKSKKKERYISNDNRPSTN